jgi:sec-independent protein translocase protein TatC
MKALLGRLVGIVTLPLRPFQGMARWLRARRQAVASFFTEVPEDVSLTETVGEAFGNRETLADTLSGLGEHIDALRRHLLRSVVALAVTTGISFAFARELMLLLARPLGADGLSQLTVIEPTESIGVFMRVSLLSGVAFAMPWIVLELYLFIAPGLMPRSRWLLLLAIPAASLLFIVGMAFTYFLMLPPAVDFLYNFLDFRASWRPSAYFGLVTSLMFWIGLAFQMPLVVYALAAVGLLNARQLARQWRVAVVVIAVLAAMVTPTIDPVNMALVMLPMAGLYAFSILGAAVAGASRRREAARHAGLAN